VQSGVHPINRMTDTTLGDGPAPEATASVKLRLAKEDVSGEIAKKHFDAFETDFFQQGEDGAGVLIDADRFDEGDGAGKNFLLSRQSWRAIAIVSTSVALLACLALWRSNSRVPVFAAAPFSPPVVSAAMAANASKAPDIKPGPAVSAWTRHSGVVSIVDIGPTILDQLGLEAPNQMEGRPMLFGRTGGSFADRINWLVDTNKAAQFRDREIASVTAWFVFSA